MDPATRSLLNSVAIMGLGTALTFAAAWFWFLKNQAVREAERIAENHGRLVERVRDLEGKLTSVTATVQPISAAFQAILIKELTHFHTPEMDKLMEKIGPPSTLTEDDENRLAVLLEQRTNDLNGEIPESERDAAVMLPYVIKRVKREAIDLRDPAEYKVVKVPIEKVEEE